MTSKDRDPVAVDVPDGDSDEQGSRSSSSRRRPGHKRKLNVWQESLLLVVIAVVVALVIKQFFLQAFYIPSESMEPGLIKDDRILVEKPSYWFGEPDRGDVVVFEDPGGWLSGNEAGPDNLLTHAMAAIGLYPEGGHLVKRVIGVPGDTIVCCDKRGRLKVNGVSVHEPYIRPGVRGGGGARTGESCAGPMTGNCSWKAGPVPEGYMFVMGDNRGRSADSSVHLCTKAVTDCSDSPYVPIDHVTGKVMALVWPLGRAHWVDAPDAFAEVPSRAADTAGERS